MRSVQVLAIAAVAGILAVAQPPKKPVYMGARACGGCHYGPGMGNQYSLWLHSKHSMAYATLAKPESLRIAAISGLRQAPQEAAICLGCHATGSQAEDWEKDDDFRIEDGVQCETCHGPGSEYMPETVMRNRQAARKAGLRMPTEQDCLVCHIEKGSHVAVLQSPTVDLKKRKKEIDHYFRDEGVQEDIPTSPAKAGAKATPKYIGSAACGKCHRGPQMGHQFSVWRMSRHAQAWASLATPQAEPSIRKYKVTDDPSKSPKCLVCHSTGFEETKAASFTIDEGIGCEACHGPGSEYSAEAIMRDRRAAVAAGLVLAPSEAVCRNCHKSASFKFEEKRKLIAHPLKLPAIAESPRYKTPLNIAVRPDGKELHVACEASDSVVVVDLLRREKVAEIPVGGSPADVAFSPSGERAFVSNRMDDTVSVIDVAARRVIKTISVGDEPHGVLTDNQGRLLYVLNTSSDDISVFDAASLKWIKNLSASRRPWSMAISPDGATILATNSLSQFAFRAPLASEVTAIETDRGVIEDRTNIAGANLMMGVAWHPSGKYALATLNRTKTLVPMTRLMQGWTITNGLAVLWRDGRVDQVLLDQQDLGFADATDVAVTPDGHFALVTSSGTDRVAVVDLDRMLRLITQASPYEREHLIPNHLGKPAEFIVKHIPVGRSPRGIALARDGRTAFVATSLDDSITVIDLAGMNAVGQIDLGGPKSITTARYGERLFHSANITFRKQFSCSSCHPDGHIDGLTYDIEADGIGVSPVDNRTLRGILDTAPFKWEGTNPSLSRQCGARLSVFFTRIQPFTPDELSAVDLYVTTIVRPPNPYHPVGSKYTPAQKRGQALFERAWTNDGREIAPRDRCITCHPPPYFTNRLRVDVGTRHTLDRQGRFDVPHLNNIYDSPPYLHNGMAKSLEEIWTVYNPYDRHGVTNDMTKDQLNDLIEYVKTL